MIRSVVLAGGGTGGHVMPALALADTIVRQDPEVRVTFVGTERGLETRLVPAAGHRLELVPAGQVAGVGVVRGLRGLLTLARGALGARALLGRLGADLVIGVGGYASVPAAAAAWTRAVPIVLLEPNARPGRSNRVLARVARRVFTQFDDAARWLPGAEIANLGFPVRDVPRRAPRESGAERPVRVLVMGGSQGARSINRAITAQLPRLRDAKLDWTHQTGAAHEDEVRAAYAAAGFEAEVAAFFDDLPQRMAGADLVVARAGAATIAELCAVGVGSILIPLPHAADDHQNANAAELERIGAAERVADREAPERLVGRVLALCADAERLEAMARAAAARARPEAAADIWASCRSLLGEAGS